MNNQLRIEKLTRFVNDEAMNRALYSFLLEAFLSDKIVDEVNVLAASRLSVKFLNEAWRDLDRFRVKQNDVIPSNNIGL